MPDGRWLGVDGDAWFLVAESPEGLVYESDAPPERLPALLRFDEDVEAWNRDLLAAAPEFGPRVAAARGLRMMRPSDPVEEAFCFLCTSNNHLARIGAMVRSLASLGEPMAEVQGHTLHRFPTLERLAAVPEPALRAQGFGYRAATIPRAAEAVLTRGGLDWFQGLAQRPRAEAHRALLELPGVGPKLADCVLLFALGHLDAVPVDTHVWRGYCTAYEPDWTYKSVTARRYAAIGDAFRARFGRRAGWAQQVLFVSELRAR